MPFLLITPQHQKTLEDQVSRIPRQTADQTAADLGALIARIHAEIPEKRRISTGRYSIVKDLGKELFPRLVGEGLSPPEIALGLLQSPGRDSFLRSLGLQLFALQSLAEGEPDLSRLYFELAAASNDWILRECSAGLVRPLIKAFPSRVREWLLELTRSPDPNLRRFVSESLRPVVENRWFHKQPEYSLGILQRLFREAAPYPRTSVGNNLSDWMRVDPGSAWPIVQRLAESGDPNSYWIAYRACRNLVKKEPARVLELLKITEYKYKDRHIKLEDLSNS